MERTNPRAGIILPAMVTTLLVVGIVAGAMLGYISHATRSAGVYITASHCRLDAQTALEQSKIGIYRQFCAYYTATRSLGTLLSWFDGWTASEIGSGGYSCKLPTRARIGDSLVSVTVAKNPELKRRFPQTATVTLVAEARQESPAGIPVVRRIQETVVYKIERSKVFDYAYFVNNHGWFQGNGVTANGNIRANGNFDLDDSSTINGNAYAAENPAISGADGTISNRSIVDYDTQELYRWQNLNTYWGDAVSRARPSTPTSKDGIEWDMGYDGIPLLLEDQELLEMPYLGDLRDYKALAAEKGGTLSQGGATLINATYSGVGPSGLANGPDKGSVLLIGTSANPIVLNGPVVVDGDVVIKGVVTGQGTIYAGRNIHIIGDISYKNAPSWPKPDSDPYATAAANQHKDLLGLAAKGNIVLGDPYASDYRGSWYRNVYPYMTPSFVKPYACDPTDESIGYPSTFNGNYAGYDGGYRIYKSTNRYGYTTYSTTSRRYYESAIGNMISDYADSSISQIDAALYNNHAVMGLVGSCSINGAMVCRDEAIIYSGKVRFNWDIRLGSSSYEGESLDIPLPVAIADPSVIGWGEVAKN
jgi:hypothetical protein